MQSQVSLQPPFHRMRACRSEGPGLFLRVLFADAREMTFVWHDAPPFQSCAFLCQALGQFGVAICEDFQRAAHQSCQRVFFYRKPLGKPLPSWFILRTTTSGVRYRAQKADGDPGNLSFSSSGSTLDFSIIHSANNHSAKHFFFTPAFDKPMPTQLAICKVERPSKT